MDREYEILVSNKCPGVFFSSLPAQRRFDAPDQPSLHRRPRVCRDPHRTV